MVIRFVRDYRGRPTGEKFFEAGILVDTDLFEYLDLPGLLAEGVVETVVLEFGEPEAPPIQLETLTVAELQSMARRLGIPYSGKRKAELVEALA